MGGSARLKGISKAHAARQPDQTPVIGKGIATKIVKAREPCLSNLRRFFLRICWLRQVRNLPRGFEKLVKNRPILGSARSQNTPGTRLPMRATGKTPYHGRS